MRLLFEMDLQDYAGCTRTFTRNSARSIILSGGRVAMVHSLKYDYYKFPGGGMEPGEEAVDALIRETAEESGLVVMPETITPYGYVHRIQRSDSDPAECFVQDNFYYLCRTQLKPVDQKLDAYEAAESYALEYVLPEIAIGKNRAAVNTPYNPMMLEREARVLELLIAEGYFAAM